MRCSSALDSLNCCAGCRRHGQRALCGIRPAPSSARLSPGRADSYNARPMAKQKKHPTGTIALNKKAAATIPSKTNSRPASPGWEVKSLRAGKAQLVDSYVLLKDGEASTFGAHITPLKTASTHDCRPDPHPQAAPAQRRLGKLFGAVQQKVTPA